MPFASDLFESVREVSEDVIGVTRPAWSSRDRAAAEILAEAARGLDLEVRYDPAGNLLCTLPGRERTTPRVLTGSHLDSVPTGGNYDGLAGAIAGLVTLAAFRDAGFQPVCDVTVIGIRGEESVWFGIAYVGSRLAVGSLEVEELDRLRRGDTGRTLAEHMAGAAVDVDRLRRMDEPWFGVANTRAFLELHIEQGPILVGRGVPVGVPTTIRGNVRFPYARCLGQYDHSAATPRAYRHDAVLATVELLHRLECHWIEQEATGIPDTVFTVGKFFTDPEHHAMTKVPGRCEFTLNFGGTTPEFLDGCRKLTERLAGEVAETRRVRFDLGEYVGSDPTPLDSSLRRQLIDAACDLGVEPEIFATVGHDASVFARAGIPSAMVLVRNAQGSHNPDEAMEIGDFAKGTKVLASTIATLAR